MVANMDIELKYNAGLAFYSVFEIISSMGVPLF
jgi:hypothetical protein